ncbi:TetR family transcriptional regulator [Arthrobacter sp. SRS-W-1-2016]|jgi:AcrR family transcriptional regulator|uniref:TetR/AcrR family transcriptional regulator n=1 Tax=Arthrobacter TaxID=1663 RepID=UPI0009912EBE|nr:MULTISPECIES: TetR/AcrR family transcriptional regulator [Arthrobacter]MDQ0212219.1 AcrR family transcriptional regulator [Arthrobacter bambusae]MDQ0234605.1 AcrR family transcriptional regulator [Arthrobacter bambusae]OOP61771.1 TetR family transcriptional regulator [Arthrobacter sp. SRS-W-1-2016]
MSFDDQLPPKTRLLRAAAELLANSDGSPVSTRQITKLAGVTAPTLYHHFGDKEGLFDAVVSAGFEEYVAGERDFAPSGVPLEDVRRMWDNHVQFGLTQPHLYLVMFGNIRPESRPAIVADAESLLEEMLSKAAIAGQINVPPREAARSILAANVGVTLMLIAEPLEDRNLELSTMTRDSMIFAVSTEIARGAAADDSGKSSVVVAAIALNAALQASHSDQLSSSELKLFLEWLHRISSSS